MRFALLCNDSPRSRCYIQNLCKSNIKPCSVILMLGGECDDLAFSAQTGGESTTSGLDFGRPDIEFNPSISVSETASSHGLNLIVVRDVRSTNSEVLLDSLATFDFDLYVLSGWSGDILTKDTLARLGRVLHVHIGRVPDYKGSTTAYYSLLEEDVVAASAFFMTEGIDEGKTISSESFRFAGCAEKIDYIVDPLVRSAVLVDTIRQLSLDVDGSSGHGNSSECRQYHGNYFVIHPLLKKLCFLTHE